MDYQLSHANQHAKFQFWFRRSLASRSDVFPHGSKVDQMARVADWLPSLVRLSGQLFVVIWNTDRTRHHLEFSSDESRCQSVASQFGSHQCRNLNLPTIEYSVETHEDGLRLDERQAEWGVGEPGNEQDYNDETHDYSRYPTGNHQGQHFSTWHHLVSCSVHHFVYYSSDRS